MLPGLGEDHFQGEHDAAELAPRDPLAQGQGRRTGVGGQQEGHRLGAGRAGLGERLERDAPCFDLRLKHQIGDIVEVRGETHSALANPSSPSLSSKPNTMLAA